MNPETSQRTLLQLLRSTQKLIEFYEKSSPRVPSLPELKRVLYRTIDELDRTDHPRTAHGLEVISTQDTPRFKRP